MSSFVFHSHDYPDSPGCYIMKSETGRILYVGKSKKLRTRLRSYFRQTGHSRKRLNELVASISSIELFLVNNEAESLLLENNLIKIHKPPYNRALKKDNSGYAYLKMTSDTYPRLDVHYRDRRKPEKLAAEKMAAEEPSARSKAPEKPELRFGPYASGRFRDAVMEFVNSHFGLRTCTQMPKRACLHYHIGRCSGICEGFISDAAYAESVRQASDFLNDRSEGLIPAMYRRMEAYAEKLDFEKANHMLHYIRILERQEPVQIVDREATINQDVVWFGDGRALIANVQEGMLRDFVLREDDGLPDPKICDKLLVDYYRRDGFRPDELIVNVAGDIPMLRKALRLKGRNPLAVTIPRRGLKLALLRLCKENFEFRCSRSGILQSG